MTDVTRLERKLDLLIALTRIGLRDKLEAERAALEADAVSTAILARAAEWVSAGELKAAARKASGQSEPTVKRRIAELVGRGALARRGGGGSVSYRSTGLLEV